MATKSDALLAEEKNIPVEQVQVLREARALTDEGFAELPDTALQRAIRKFDYPDMPRERLAFRLAQDGLRRGGEQRYGNAITNALNQLYALRMQVLPGQRAGMPVGGLVPTLMTGILAPPPAAGLSSRAWQSIGPGSVGGRTRAIVIHPTNHQRMWLGSAGGGIWQSNDGGASWMPVDDFMANLSVTSLVMDQSDPNLMYAGTGEGFGNLDSLRGAGVFRTTDGTNWTQIAATDRPEFHRINRLALSSDGIVLLAATNAGVFRSTDAARAVWERVLNFSCADVKFHPTDSDKGIAGSLDTGRAWQTRDGGRTWRQATHTGTWSGRVELCYALADPNRVYASINVDNGQIWRSINGGRSFARRKGRNQDGRPAGFLGGQGWYDNVIWAGDPTDRDLLVVGGVDLWRSTDGGNQLRDISTWWDSDSAHADHHAIVSHPAFDGVGNRTVWFGNDGGIYRADDIMTVGNDPVPPRKTGWVNLNNGYGVTQFFGGAVNPTSGIIVCGAQDNGTLAYDPARGPDDWRTIFGGDGGFCAADPTDSKVFYGEYVRLNIHRNEDGATSDDTAGDRYISGQFFNHATRQWDWKPVPFRIPDAFNERALFIAPFALDPNQSQTLLAGGESLWRTTDARAPNTPTSGPRWQRIKPPANGLISAIAIDPGDSDQVWVGHEFGEVWRSDNATAASPAWTRIDGQGPQPLDVARFCHQILVSPHDANLIFVAFGGYRRGNIWRSDDRGATWSDIGAALPEAPIRAIAVHPTQPEWVYLGTEVGIFGSDNLGQDWSPTNEGPANVSVDDLIWSGTTLIAVTHGRGVFTIDLS